MESQIPIGTLAIDAMGSDHGPSEIVEGVRLALDKFREADESTIILVGDELVLNPCLKSAGLENEKRLRVVHAPEVIGMDEKPLQGLKSKRNSSMVVALEMVKAGQAKAILSCGNTGSLMAGGTLKVRPLQGVDRPALATVIPSRDRHFILIDAGADPESKPANMVQNAILGSHYAEVVLGIERPRVGLLTIGVEEGKGNERVNDTHMLLKAINGMINYRGLIEGFQVFDDEVDVVVCDGFTGNIVLKVCESLFHLLKGYLSDELKKTPIRKFGALLSLGAYKSMRQHLSPDQYGAAPLLGLKAPVLKAHGSSNRFAIASATRIALQVVQQDMTEQIQRDILQANELLHLFPGQNKATRPAPVS
jgi:glycerol-3-phosphate acyltransferase PlsX